MNQQGLIFLNATGAPVLSRADSRQMRAYITKSNFAKRRQRTSQVETKGNEGNEKTPQQALHRRKRCQQKCQRTSWEANPTKLPTRESPPCVPSMQLLRNFRYLVFLDIRPTVQDPVEKAWFDLITSEPVVFEASLAGGMRCWGPDKESQQNADLHLSRATKLLVDRISCEQVPSDAMIGAVMTMAFGERMADNDEAWNVHMEGLIKMMQQRRHHGASSLPPVLRSLIALDFMNHILGFPRFYHPKVVDMLRSHGDQVLSTLAPISTDISLLKTAVGAPETGHVGQASHDIEGLLERLRLATQALREFNEPYIKATSRSLEIYLNLLWPLSFPIDLDSVGTELKEAVREFRIKACPYMDLTSPHYILGLLATEKDSEARCWFQERLQGPLHVMRQRGWSDPLSLMKRGLEHEPHIHHLFTALWGDEINGAM
ncbi:unnamed protein product [Clonostachys rhizophaga]|uniref:Uncharacterized protein n=1 Tax=Clonostachys rhizophaga TaxID=160324 RepID=A0A9N9VYI6_9HYPO|nr:unnamed protein product [Clonostachys rhizophaga]